MRRVLLILFAVGLLSTGFTSCRDKKDIGDDIEDVVDDVGDALE